MQMEPKVWEQGRSTRVSVRLSSGRGRERGWVQIVHFSGSSLEGGGIFEGGFGWREGKEVRESQDFRLWKGGMVGCCLVSLVERFR